MRGKSRGRSGSVGERRLNRERECGKLTRENVLDPIHRHCASIRSVRVMVAAPPDRNAISPLPSPPAPRPELPSSPSVSVSDTSSPPQRLLHLHKADFTVNSLVDKIGRGKLNLRPKYQREYVWDRRTASKLIESLILNVPIPTLFFHETEHGYLEVVDGKQRLTSVYSFVAGGFPDGSKFKLSGLDVYEELNGCEFKDLSEAQQETIKDFPLNVHTISRGCEPDFVFEVFERLNMGATQLNEQELRNCIYLGQYTDLLGQLVMLPTMLNLMNNEEPHMRMRDRELCLRFFAMMRTSPYGFRTPVKGWLNEEIRLNQYMEPQEAQSLKLLFSETIDLTWKIFGSKAFRPVKIGATKRILASLSGSNTDVDEDFGNGEINVAQWDTLMYSFAIRVTPALSSNEDNGIIEQMIKKSDRIRGEWISLITDPGFKKVLLSNSKSVIARHEIWEEKLIAILSE